MITKATNPTPGGTPLRTITESGAEALFTAINTPRLAMFRRDYRPSLREGQPLRVLPLKTQHPQYTSYVRWDGQTLAVKHRGGTTAASESGGASPHPGANELAPIAPHTEVPDGAGLLIYVRAVLDGSSTSAQRLYGRFVQEYAEQLGSESARQEASARAPGARTTEITESIVIRARESLEQRAAERQRPDNLREAAALAGTPILSGSAGVMGNNLHSPLQWTAFTLCALGAVICILYLLKRRLL
jgi:hypothetical protein